MARMNPFDVNVPPSYNSRPPGDKRENTTVPSRISGRKRHRAITPNNDFSTSSQLPPVVIDLTADTEPESNQILLSDEQDFTQFERDRVLAQELQQQEIAIANARNSHSNIRAHRAQPSYFRTPPIFPSGYFNYHRPSERDHAASFQPPWSSSNTASPIFDFLRRDFSADDYEFLSSLDATVKKKPAASRKEISSLPTKKLKVTDFQAGDRCAICIEEYVKGDRVKTLPCNHFFHTKCINQWLKVNKVCPVDRKDITDSPHESPWKFNCGV